MAELVMITSLALLLYWCWRLARAPDELPHQVAVAGDVLSGQAQPVPAIALVVVKAVHARVIDEGSNLVAARDAEIDDCVLTA